MLNDLPVIAYSDRFVVLSHEQTRRAARLALIDLSQYSWGHAGPAHVFGRVLITVDTIGM